MSSCCGGGAAAGHATTIAEREVAVHTRRAVTRPGTWTTIPAGVFAMGDTFGEGDASERPVHPVRLPAFEISTTTVTNAGFAEFVADTGHITDAEAFGVSAVFAGLLAAPEEDVVRRLDTTPWWLAVRGADWRHPGGRHSDLDGLARHPVVHVSWRDAQAWCAWAAARLPTEAEWERAARGTAGGRRFPWGDALGVDRLNIFRGDFPVPHQAEGGWVGTAPAAAYDPNSFGLFNTVGNVWEWCQDWFGADTYVDSSLDSPTGPPSGAERALRGGSFLCHDSYCRRYRVAARSSNTPDSTASNIGFRAAADTAT